MRRFYLSIFILIITVLISALGIRKYQQRSPVFDNSLIGTSAPSFSLPGLEGGTVELSSYKGKLVLINFWASWCPPCRKEFPTLVQAQQNYQNASFTIIGIANEGRQSALNFSKQAGANFPIAFDDSENHATASAYGNPDGALPYSVLISPDHKILATYPGILSDEKLHGLINQQLSEVQ